MTRKHSPASTNNFPAVVSPSALLHKHSPLWVPPSSVHISTMTRRNKATNQLLPHAPVGPTPPWAGGAKNQSTITTYPVGSHPNMIRWSKEPINHYNIPLSYGSHPIMSHPTMIKWCKGKKQTFPHTPVGPTPPWAGGAKNQSTITTYPVGSHPNMIRWSKEPTNHYNIPLSYGSHPIMSHPTMMKWSKGKKQTLPHTPVGPTPSCPTPPWSSGAKEPTNQPLPHTPVGPTPPPHTPVGPTPPWSGGAKEPTNHYNLPLWVPPHHYQVEQRTNQPLQHTFRASIAASYSARPRLNLRLTSCIVCASLTCRHCDEQFHTGGHTSGEVQKLALLCCKKGTASDGHVKLSYREIRRPLQPQNERCQQIKSHMSSGEITDEHFQSLEYLVQKCGPFSNLVAQLSVPNS